MRQCVVGALLFLGLCWSAWSQGTPQGWSTLRDTIQKTPISKISELQDKNFDLQVTGRAPGDTLAVTPKEAFKVIELPNGTFRITIANPSNLLELPQPGKLREYREVGYSWVHSEPLPIAIEGTASCRYYVRFAQKGASDLNLSELEAAYDVSWSLSDPAAGKVEKNGDGLLVTRAPDKGGPVRVVLRMNDKGSSKQLSTEVPIAACVTPQDQPIATPPTTTSKPRPDTCIIEILKSVQKCAKTCGAATLEAQIQYEFRNVCAQRVKCEQMSWEFVDKGQRLTSSEYWVDLGPDQATKLGVMPR